MGRLIKNHWARLIVLSAAAYQVAAAIEAYFWPKIFWDFITTNLDGAVRPIPSLQTVNLVMGLIMLAWEWPVGFIAGSSMHRSIEVRLAILPMAALSAILLYQGTNAAIYYMIGMVVYFWAYSEGEIICAKPWTLPQRSRGGGSRV
ncbi:PRO41 protein [Gaeumannomyces tritici R3-111a-1]|uniref:PRO41 protein n=1 Tax=Gaeumannomyces tritici (strain R3-111a-1) TaxID=644352 RepID=J3PFB9_GAET3|nr:PRO41 protein [Gaeumannomyces tritici R3-111a-1]EJT70021.1 PRO41 protein [Gaeumannomyces tritici R3-111a-1]